MPLFHPSDIALRRFADQQPVAPSLTRHLEKCAQCRSYVASVRELGARARVLPDIDAGEDLLRRIMDSRRGDVRVILPVDDEAPRTASRIIRNVAVAAAIIVAALFALPIRSNQAPTASDSELSGIRSFLGSVDFTPPAVEARGISQLTTNALRGRALAPMTLRYQRRWLDANGKGGSKTGGDHTVSIQRGGADSGWFIHSVWTGLLGGPDLQNARTQTEEVRLTRTLAPISRVVHVTPYRRWEGIDIAQHFSGDSVLGQMSLPGTTTRRPIAHSLAASWKRLVPSDALGPVFLMGIQLSVGWTADADFLGWAVVPDDVTYPVTLTVVGSERVTVPAGTFDCWKISIAVFGQTHYQWVRKTDNLGIRVRHAAAEEPGVREEVLISEKR